MVMIGQRPTTTAPVVRAIAEALPFSNQSFDVAIALWTIHHWTDLRRGLKELRRVARRIVIVTSSTLMNRVWLTSDYWPGMAEQRRDDIQPNAVVGALGTPARVEPLPLPRDCTDGMGEAFWARPEAYGCECARRHVVLSPPRSRGTRAWAGSAHG